MGENVIREIEVVSICKKGGKDRIVWPSTRDGRYTVKARYQIMKENIKKKIVEKTTSSHQIDERVWKMIRKLKVPTKVKNFMWRPCGESSPSIKDVQGPDWINSADLIDNSIHKHVYYLLRPKKKVKKKSYMIQRKVSLNQSAYTQ